MKRYLQFVIMIVGTIGIFSTVLHDALFADIVHPIYSLRLFRYFTLLSNLIAVIYFWILFQFKLDESNKQFKHYIGGVAIYTTVTGVVFATVLEGLYQEQGLMLLGSICLHYVNPILVLGYLVYYRNDMEFEIKESLLWLIFPIIYLIFAMVHGGITGNYLYPFLDVSTLGYLSVITNVLLLFGLFSLLSFSLVKIVSKK